jgi:type I restriction enzyme M protein
VKIRELIVKEYGLQAVINLPSGVFRPYAGVGTAILILDKSKSKRKKDDFIWIYDVTADGFSLDDKRTPIEANDIPDVLAKWEKREEGANSYRVPIAKILESEDYSLAAGKYKPITAQATNHDVPQDILHEVLELEDAITKKTKSLLQKISR